MAAVRYIHCCLLHTHMKNQLTNLIIPLYIYIYITQICVQTMSHQDRLEEKTMKISKRKEKETFNTHGTVPLSFTSTSIRVGEFRVGWILPGCTNQKGGSA